MKTLPSDPLASYQAGARAARAKTIGSLALGATALAAWPAAAEAQIVVDTLSGANTRTLSNGLFFDMATGVGATSDFGGSTFEFIISTNPNGSTPYWSGMYTQNKGFGFSGVVISGSAQGPAIKFASGTTIGAGLNFTGNYHAVPEFNEYYGAPVPAWVNATGYVGVKFNLVDGTHYGWIDIQTNADATNIQILGAAYESVAGESIEAGQTSAVPEPASAAALLGLGAAGAALYRRRKNLRRAA